MKEFEIKSTKLQIKIKKFLMRNYIYIYSFKKKYGDSMYIKKLLKAYQ